MDEPIFLYAVLVPAVAGVVCYVLAKWLARAAVLLGILAVVATFLLCCLLPLEGPDGGVAG
ncbi:MAG: hypothetical protein ACODAJ_10380, partial [Planctomycetota bacterium]